MGQIESNYWYLVAQPSKASYSPDCALSILERLAQCVHSTLLIPTVYTALHSVQHCVHSVRYRHIYFTRLYRTVQHYTVNISRTRLYIKVQSVLQPVQQSLYYRVKPPRPGTSQNQGGLGTIEVGAGRGKCCQKGRLPA